MIRVARYQRTFLLLYFADLNVAIEVYSFFPLPTVCCCAAHPEKVIVKLIGLELKPDSCFLFLCVIVYFGCFFFFVLQNVIFFSAIHIYVLTPSAVYYHLSVKICLRSNAA